MYNCGTVSRNIKNYNWANINAAKYKKKLKNKIK